MRILEHLIGTYESGNTSQELVIYRKWYQIVGALGPDGMSSEESDQDDNLQQVLRVTKMPWRRNMDMELEMIDDDRWNPQIFPPQGSKPLRRIREADNPVSSRKAVKKLPIAFYDDEWLNEDSHRKLAYKISDVDFGWLNLAYVAQAQ